MALSSSRLRLMYAPIYIYIYNETFIFSRDLTTNSLHSFMSGEASRSLSSAIHEIETQSRLKEVGVFSNRLGGIDHVI